MNAGPWGAYGKKFEETLQRRQLPNTWTSLRVYAGLPNDGHDDTTECIWG
ncbi:hypothetical protein [Streptomyces sp. NPDC001315]